ncbi:MAG: methyltransferase [Bacteroidales bacterium]|nr:methyltransferase [Bacteroidales bacterium]MCF8391197.1 methyltransferase [Bacteroidales bacterium]
MQINRPDPIVSDSEIYKYTKRQDPQIAIEALMAGDFVIIKDFYSTGLALLAVLKQFLTKSKTQKTHKEQRDTRSVYREVSHRLLLQIRNHKLVARKAPEIGWLEKLYPELEDFFLPFPQVQGLNSAWQWYEKGITIPVLHRKIHPFFGVYFPTRFEHLNLFDSWLKEYRGPKDLAFDVGIGCGVLSFQMIKHNFKRVIGSDSNPNAIFGLKEDQNAKHISSKIELLYGDLFVNSTEKSELIVFNPPWLPATQTIEGLDSAIYYDEDLFNRFFEQAKEHLLENGRLVLLFSNLAQISGVTKKHPIKKEILEGGRFQKELFMEKKADPASKKTRRDQLWRNSEMVELWVLKPAEENNQEINK